MHCIKVRQKKNALLINVVTSANPSLRDAPVTTLVVTVPRVLNLLWTWNYCCKLEKLEIVCADGSPFLVTKGFDALREDH